jgi:hypothetical protein
MTFTSFFQTEWQWGSWRRLWNEDFDETAPGLVK